MDESLKRQIHEECRIRNRSEGTCKQYTFHIGKFLDWIGDKPLNELTLYDAREYIIKNAMTELNPKAVTESAPLSFSFTDTYFISRGISI